jgi:glycosyltransferase involved in cell wall biosynthesis
MPAATIEVHMTRSARPSLCIYGPGPRDRSGVSRYIADSMPLLETKFRCFWSSNSAPADPAGFDAVLYHIGNNRLHHLAYRALRVRPGPVILHEHNTLGYYLDVWDRLEADERTDVRVLLGQHTDGAATTFEEAAALADLSDCPLPAWDIGVERLVLKRTTIGLVHSPSLAAELAIRHPWATVAPLTFPSSTRDTASRAEVCRQLGLPADKFLFGSLGVVSHHKQVHALVDAWCSWTSRPADAALIIAGDRLMPLPPTQRQGIYEFDFLPDALFDALVNAVDCAIQLRHPTMGETSGVVAAFAAAGTELIVSDTPANRDTLGTANANVRWIAPGPPVASDLISAMNSAHAQRGRSDRSQARDLWTEWLSQLLPVLVRNP